MRTPEEIESILDRMESFLNQYDEADKAFMDKQDADNWNSKFGERLGQYSDKLKQLNGDDFDIIESSRKEYKDSYSDLSDDDYVNALEENIKKVLDRVWPEATEEQKQEVAEEAASETDAEPAKTETKTETKVETEAPKAEDETKEDEATSDMNAKENPDMDNTVEHVGRDGQKFWGNPRFSGGRSGKTSDEEEKECLDENETEEDPVEAFRKELEEYKANMPKRG